MTGRVRVLALSSVVEGGMLVLAFPLGAWLDAPPFDRTAFAPHHLVFAAVAIVPMFALFVWSVHSRARFCVRIRELLEGSFMPLFDRSSAAELLFVSALAGLGEEALFRGVFQQAIAHWGGAPLGLVAASVVFGLAHAVTWAYAVIATLIGLYLGALFSWSNDLWLPIAAHAGYDFLALRYMQRRRRARLSTEQQ